MGLQDLSVALIQAVEEDERAIGHATPDRLVDSVAPIVVEPRAFARTRVAKHDLDSFVAEAADGLPNGRAVFTLASLHLQTLQGRQDVDLVLGAHTAFARFADG
jgi:hypothetical protein